MKQPHGGRRAAQVGACLLAFRAALGGVLLSAALLGGCGRKAEPSVVTLSPLAEGLDYARVAARYGEDRPAATHVLRLDPKRWRLVHVTDKDTGRKLSDAKGFRLAAKAAAAFNGIYFDPQYRPLGLMVSRGEQLRRLRRVDHGVFSVAAAGPSMQHAREWQEPEGLDFAAECGPRLVVDGEPLTFKPGLARRTALGFDAEGRVYVVVTQGVVSLTHLADFLARERSAGGLGLRGALNLDGGSSTMFDLDHGGVRASVRSAVLVPVGVAVVPRSGDAAPR